MKSTYWITRFIYLRFLGLIYFFVFLPMTYQYRALIGESGLLPAHQYLGRLLEKFPNIWHAFWNIPTLFWFNSTDTFVLSIINVGLILSLFLLFGFGNFFTLFILWFLQLSFINIGQTFWSFGWETNLLEITFLCLFWIPLCDMRPFSQKVFPSKIIIYLHLWVLFRLMFGAGLIKLRGDACWTDLTCLNYHFETQPIPNPLSPFFHFLPDLFKQGLVFINHFVELIIPFFLIFGRKRRIVAGLIFLAFQIGIIISGNYAWINLLTIGMIIPCFDDEFFKVIGIKLFSGNKFFKNRLILNSILAIVIIFLSYKPILNLFGPHQIMNRSYDQFHLVNSYGVFGSVTKKRYEIIIEGTADKIITESTKWLPYEIPCKPGDINKAPCVIAPYHFRLTWQLWFAAMSSYEYNPWIVHLVANLLRNDFQTLTLFEKIPFQKEPPHFVRLELYEYSFADIKSKIWYNRKRVKTYLPPLSLENEGLLKFLIQKGW